MKKTITKALLFILLCSQGEAQTEQENHLKYWNYRENLNRKFIKIGSLTNTGYPDPGVSIPLENLDNINIGCNGAGKRMRWGDATLHQGYYIATLATEYELLNRAGKDCQGTLNELYYAIAAINRLDEGAESYLNFPNGNLPPNHNGFLLRDDVPGNFNNYFQDPPPNNISCIHSERYSTENGSVNNNFFNQENEMSQDQIYGLLFGFSFVKKFIPAGLIVQPTPQDLPLNLVDEVKAITDRTMAYCEQQWSETKLYWAGPTCGDKYISYIKNWTIKNPITGENVTRGANMDMFVPYAADQAYLINGQNYNGNISYGIDFPGLEPQCLTNNSTNPSVSFSQSSIKNIWNSFQSMSWSDFVLTLSNIPKIDLSTFTLSTYNKTYNVMDNSNRQMMLSLVSCTNSWTKANTGRLAWDANMGIFDLVRSVLHGGGTWAPQSVYFNELNLAPCEGPNSTTQNNPAPWHSASRWWKPSGSTVTGEFNGIDYMLLYNLYMLEFGNQVPSITFQNLSCPCTGSAQKIDPFINSSNGLLNTQVMLQRKFPEYTTFGISVPEYLTQPLTLVGPTNLQLKTELVVCNNTILKTWSNNSLIIGSPSGIITESGILRVRSGSQFWLESDGEAILHPNSKIIIEKGATFILRHNAKLIVNDYAQVIVEDGATFIWGQGSTMVMQGETSMFDVQSTAVVNVFAGEKFLVTKGTAAKGGTVNLHDAIFTLGSNGLLQLDDATLRLSGTSQFIYQPNAVIELPGTNATLSLHGFVYLDHNATFTFSYPNAVSGQLQFGDMVMTAGNNCKFMLNGAGKGDVMLQLSGNAEVADNLLNVSISNGSIEGHAMPGSTGLSLGTASDPVNLSNCVLSHYNALQFYGQHVYITNCDFLYNTTALSDCYTGGLHHNLSVLNSTFSHCQTPLFTSSIGLSIYGSTIENNDEAGWTGLGLGYNSYITNCNFTDNSSKYSTGIQLDYSALSPAAISIKSSSLINTGNWGDIGINASGGNLNLRCNTIAGNNLSNITYPSMAVYLADNAYANMSSDFNAGYNNLSQNASLFQLSNAYAEINNGFNNFATPQNNSCYNNFFCVPFIHGSVYGLACNGNNHLLDAGQNYWGKNTTFHPGSAAFDLEVAPQYSCIDDVNYQDQVPSLPPSCPLFATTGSVSGTNALFNGINVSTINTQRFPLMKLNNAVNSCIALMDTSVTNGFKSAVQFLTEILNYTIVNPTPEDKYIQQIAYRKLMESLSQASYYAQLPDSLTSFHQDIINLQQATINGNPGYSKKFYASVDQAAVYRLADSLPQAIAVLQSLLTWLQPEDIEYVNEWICYFNAEYDLRTGQLNRKDFRNAIASCRSVNNPRMVNNASHVTVPLNEENSRLVISPNPNRGSFTIMLKNQVVQSVTLYDAVGNCVYNKNQALTEPVSINLADGKTGIYLIKAISNSGKVFSEKIVIE